MDPTVQLAVDTVNMKKQALVFANTKRSAEKTSDEIAKKLAIMPESLSEDVINAVAQPTKQCRRLSENLKKGVAFHHAGLTQKQREIIEDGFREGRVKIICSTPTLAAGVDLPAFRAIIKDLKRYGQRGMQYIPVLEYLQMAGRAGRPSYDKWGEAICIASSEGQKEEIVDNYINGEPEEIYSKLAVEPVLRTYLLSLIATGFVKTHEQIIEFFSKTFWAFQYEDLERMEMIIDKMLNLLKKWDFIKGGEKEDFVSASEVNMGKYEATLMGKRVAELYLDPLTASRLCRKLNKADRHVTSFALLHMICDTIEMCPLLSVRTKEWDDMNEFLAEHDGELLEDEPAMFEPEYDDYMKAVKTAMMMQEWIDEKDEEYLLEKYNIRPGETRFKVNNGDWLLYAAGEMAKILAFRDVQKEVVKLRIRLKYGVKEELLALLKLQGIGRVRARKMFFNGIKDIGDVKKVDISKLGQLIGKAAAASVKEQVGEKVEKVSERKRVGQMSLRKY